MTKYFVIASGKGGVGKTTSAINLATALTKIGKSTVLVDGNISTPNVGIHLGAPNVPISLNEALQGKAHISSAAYLHNSGLKVIPMNVSLEKPKIENLEGVLAELDGLVDVVVLDSDGSIGKEAETVLKAAHEVLVVTTPDLPSVSDTLKTIRLSEKHGIKVSGVIVNRVRYDKYEMADENIEAILGKPILVKIPEDMLIRTALHQKQPVVHSSPRAPASKEYIRLAHILLGRHYEDMIIKNAEKKSLYNKVMLALGFNR